MSNSSENSRDIAVTANRGKIFEMLELVAQKRTLLPGKTPPEEGLFKETGLYPAEFVILRDSIFDLFKIVGAYETERIMEKIFSQMQGRLSQDFVINLKGIIKRTANKVRASKALNN
jgi:hypothetical protein